MNSQTISVPQKLEVGVTLKIEGVTYKVIATAGGSSDVLRVEGNRKMRRAALARNKARH